MNDDKTIKTLFIGIDPSITESVVNTDHNGIVFTTNLYESFDESNFKKLTVNTPTNISVNEKYTFVINTIIAELNNYLKTNNYLLSDFDYTFLFIEEYKVQNNNMYYNVGKDVSPMNTLIYLIENKFRTLINNINIKEIRRQQAKFIKDTTLREYGLLTYGEKVPLHERDACRVLLAGQDSIKKLKYPNMKNKEGIIDYE